MKNRAITIIVVLSSIAMLGLIAAQAYWVNKAYDLSQKHFEHRVYSGLYGAMLEISWNKKPMPKDSANMTEAQILLARIRPGSVDTSLYRHFGYNQVDNKYEFAIVLTGNDSVVYESPGYVRDVKKEKIFKKCLWYMPSMKNFSVRVIFPQIQKTLVGDIWFWLFLSGFFLMVVILCFAAMLVLAYRNKKLSEMKTDFINNITHEFKTPISTISLASEILVNVNQASHIDKVKRYANIIQEENRRMQMQVEQVLRMSKLDKKEFELNKENIDLNELVTNAVENLCLDLDNPAIKVHFSMSDKKIEMGADPVHLTNIVKNLIDNACKYSKGNPQITVSTSLNNTHATVSIADKGIGIEHDKLKYIFEKFYRVPTGDVHDVKGSGIGLYYVKVMTEAHGGKVIVKSELGKGSQFDIVLPLK